MKYLNEILSNIAVIQLIGNDDIAVKGVHFDSRKIETDYLFVAVSGTQTDGHKFIDKAIKDGAKAIVCEDIPAKTNENITYVKVENTETALAEISAAWFDYPSRQIALIGVTGTNGKTTTATLLYYLFRKLGYKTGLISTIAYFVDDQKIKATHTTPDTITLNSILKQMVDEGCEYCFMEVSSHAIAQNRIESLAFSGGIFSNITHDHLDYHGTFDEYLKVKKSFFDTLPKQAFALVNVDDRNGDVMLQNTRAKQHTYALKSMADFKCRILEKHIDGMKVEMDRNELWTSFTGTFNAYNLLAVYATAILLGEEQLEVLTAISALPAVKGRFETIRSDNGLTAIIDYAHTPDALKNVLNAINDIRNGSGQLLTVVGAGGDRDKTKRPVMAKVAVNNSTKVILTSDNPRTEDPVSILSEMQKGIDSTNLHKTLTITDRREAIKTACMLANPGDIILIAGKGHEDYQEINGVRHHFDDKEVVKECFELNK